MIIFSAKDVKTIITAYDILIDKEALFSGSPYEDGREFETPQIWLSAWRHQCYLSTNALDYENKVVYATQQDPDDLERINDLSFTIPLVWLLKAAASDSPLTFNFNEETLRTK